MAALLVIAVAAPAQERLAIVRVASGETITGRVVSIDLDQITLEVDGNQIRIATARITSCDFETLPAATEPAPEAVSEPDPAPAAEGAGNRPAREPPPKGRRSAAGTPGAIRGSKTAASMPAAGMGGPRIYLQERLLAFKAAYSWLRPDDLLQLVSLCLTGFALLALAVHVAVRVVANDPPGLLRCLAITTASALLLFANVAFVPGNPMPLAVAAIVTLALMMFLFRQFAELDFLETLLALMVLAMQIAVAFGVLELCDAALHTIGKVAE
jgi:hypothetical protein